MYTMRQIMQQNAVRNPDRACNAPQLMLVLVFAQLAKDAKPRLSTVHDRNTHHPPNLNKLICLNLCSGFKLLLQTEISPQTHHVQRVQTNMTKPKSKRISFQVSRHFKTSLLQGQGSFLEVQAAEARPPGYTGSNHINRSKSLVGSLP